MPTRVSAAARSLAALLIASAALAAPARAFPQFAEEWFVPGHPQEVEVDATGRVWVACFDDSIRVYAPSGGELLFAFGGSGSGDGQFQNPYGMAFDADGNVYICDYLGVRIEKFDAMGNYLTQWPTPGVRTDHVAIDPAGDLYVSDFSQLGLHKYDAAGTPLLDWTTNGGTYPSGVVVSDGLLHVVQWSAPVVEQYLLDGTYAGQFETGAFHATDIEVDAAGLLWVADYEPGIIRVFAPNGFPVDSAGAYGTGPGEFIGLSGLAVTPAGVVYAADEENSRVQVFAPFLDGVTPRVPRPPVAAAFRSIAPNPARGAVTLSYVLAGDEHVRLSLHDVTGRLVARLAAGVQSGGPHQRSWDGRDAGGARLPAGVYLARLEHGGRVESRRLVLVP